MRDMGDGVELGDFVELHDAVQIDEDFTEPARAAQKQPTSSVSHSANRQDPTPKVVPLFSRGLTFAQWSQKRQEEWRQTSKKKSRS